MDEVGVVFIDRRRSLCLRVCVCMCWCFLSISYYQSISHVIKEIFIYYFNILIIILYLNKESK